MAIAPFNKDMDIIQQLDDEPNDVGGLTAQELKEKFDEGGNALKNYINQTLIPALEGLGVNAIIRTGSEGSLRYLRLNSDKVLESSADGAVWEATGSSGHIIVGQDGTQLPQRSRLQFVGCEVSDDAGATVVQIGAVPTTRTVNGKPLSGDITLTAADVGAAETFIAEIGVTTQAEIDAAYQSGKQVMAYNGTTILYLVTIEPGVISFFSGGPMIFMCQGNNWSNVSDEQGFHPANHSASHAVDGVDELTPSDIGAAPAYTYGTTDLVAGTSPLETGKLHFVYE